jgi:hypothetical protein
MLCVFSSFSFLFSSGLCYRITVCVLRNGKIQECIGDEAAVRAEQQETSVKMQISRPSDDSFNIFFPQLFCRNKDFCYFSPSFVAVNLTLNRNTVARALRLFLPLSTLVTCCVKRTSTFRLGQRFTLPQERTCVCTRAAGQQCIPVFLAHAATLCFI